MPKVLCIYHKDCTDGFGAAWAVRHALGRDNVEFHAASYDDPPPPVADRDVVVVDFSYKRPVFDELARDARTVLVLDHHKTAADELRGLPVPPATYSALRDPATVSKPFRACALFDMERSGAGLAWDYFHPDAQSRPDLINHIEDRDLWRFALPGTRQIQAALFSYPFDFEVWDDLMRTDIADLHKEGIPLLRSHQKDVDQLVRLTRRRMKIAGFEVPVANIPPTMVSDAGELLAQGAPFAACYWDSSPARVFSLRSAKDGLDVSAIAQRYGGGGHAHAAGFRVAIGWEGDR